MYITRNLVLILLVISVKGYSRNCIFKPESNCVEKLKIYIDRNGNIYPPSNLYKFDTGLFYNPPIDGSDNTSDLRIYFRNDPRALSSICQFLGLDVSFKKMQRHFLDAYANKINQEIKKNKKIIFFIHGFNNSYEESHYSYKLLRKQLSSHRNLAIVEVYWDGLENNPMKIWTKAQPNSAFAGLTIRKLLSNVDESATIKFLTHSLGASVATETLFNVEKWPPDFQNEINQKADKIATPPQKNITLCMLAPAIPGQNTFNDINNTVENNTSKNIDKIIIGYNRKDKALRKIVGIPRVYGSTTLGCDSRREIVNTLSTLSTIVPHIKYKIFDLSDKPRPREHSVEEYIRADLFDEFLNEIFTD